MQMIKVGQILDKMECAGQPLGTALFFCPQKQIRNERAANQQARYVAQIDLRFDLETQWRMIEQDRNKTILVKLVLPANTEDEVSSYLAGKGINRSFVYPDAV
jgi:hypothetical protein